MSAATTVGRAETRWPAVAGWVFTGLAVLFAWLVYWGLGPAAEVGRMVGAVRDAGALARRHVAAPRSSTTSRSR